MGERAVERFSEAVIEAQDRAVYEMIWSFI